MLHLEGDYTKEERTLKYKGRVFPIKQEKGYKYINGIGQEVFVKDRDCLMQLGNGTWFAWYSSETLEDFIPK